MKEVARLGVTSVKAAAGALGTGEVRSLRPLVHMAVSAAENEGGDRI